VSRKKSFKWYSLVNSKKSLDYLDNNILILVWSDYMYCYEIGRLQIKKNLKFARFPPKIIPFPDHPFNNYPRLQITFPYYRLNSSNSFDCPHNNWMDHYKWDRTILQKHDCITFIYWTLMRQWIYFVHKGEYFAKYRFPSSTKNH
jgi:hypothetical protein